MITTVTTTTASAVSSVTTVIEFSGSLALITVLCLIAFLILKETLTTSASPTGRSLSRALNVAIVPLLMAFGMLTVGKVLELFS